MDHLAHQTRAGLPGASDEGAAWAPMGAAAAELAVIPGGQVERRQQREGTRLQQTVRIRRRDGSVWTALARQLALPADPGEADRATAQASHVLDLLARAVGAADTARQARGAMLEWDQSPPPWAARYG
ncbi:hypothetical protein E2C06_19005 [Dankookia rubra]|uniref:Uncharacterized protein n=1 Tax=Dankookia rubra TaxID=1442381 RepID=A0A4R5QF55_9PROT|nr:hypothetical protein [Dankookia rubra]TDH61067.1 hypothetical protein E2C06_19005 [Dankookia rubra]